MTDKLANRPDPTPAVIYAAKSTEDKKGSIGTQLADCCAMAEREDWGVRGEHQDEGFSAFKGNRGPGLEAAKVEAIRIAAEEGSCILLVQHSDRIARGAGDAPDAADHLVEVVASLRRRGVTLRTVQDDHFQDDTALLMAAVNGQRNTEDSARKSRAVRDGKRRQLERGERLGGRVPDGYTLTVERDDSDKIVARVYSFDPARESIIRLIFDLALAGTPDTQIARTLNGEGHRTVAHTIKSGPKKGQTKGGVKWSRRRVQSVVLNPFYAGLIGRAWDNPHEETVIVPGHHPGFIAPEQHQRLMAERKARDLNQGGHAKTGAPTRNHLLDGGEDGLAGCHRCGGPMRPITSTYRRKSDGGRARCYRCAARHDGTGTCDAPDVKAELIEGAIIAHLDGCFVDFESWINTQTEQRANAARTLEADLDGERAAIAKARTKEGKLADLYADAADDDAERPAAALAMKRQAERREAAEVRAAELERLIAEASAPAPVDDALDWFNGLAAAVRGATAGTELREVNEGLKQTFRRFWLDTTEDGDVEVVPELHRDLMVRLVPGEDGMHLAPGQIVVGDEEGNFTPVPNDVPVPPELLAYMRTNPAPIPVLVEPGANETERHEYL